MELDPPLAWRSGAPDSYGSATRCAEVVRVDHLRGGIRQCLGAEDEETGKEQAP